MSVGPGAKYMWGERRFIAYVLVAIAIGAFASHEGWLAHRVVMAALRSDNAPASVTAASELQLAARSFFR
jgi:hypothetical protein